MKRILGILSIAAVLAAVSAPAFAGGKERSYANVKVTFDIKADGVNYTAETVNLSGNQCNYNAITTATVSGIMRSAIKRTSVIGNFLPTISIDNGNKVDLQFQIEFSSQGDPEHADVFLQTQGEIETEMGKPVVVVSDPQKRVVVTVEKLK